MKKGFTLIELSIVLIIIGLIIGGILAGQQLVNQARNRGIIKEINDYTTLLGAFQLKYSALPGDMPNATTYWSTSGNGNGNGQIDLIETVTGNGIEKLRCWDHLYKAGILQSTITFSNTYTSTSNPISAVDGIGIDIGYQGPLYSVGPYNFLGLSHKLSTSDMYSIDLKIDDGLAASGKFLGLGPLPFVSGHCTTADWSNSTASYILPDPNGYKDCRIYYALPF